MGGKSGDNWANLSIYGRYISRSLKLLMKEVKAEEAVSKEQGDNYRMSDEVVEKQVTILNALARAARTQAVLVDVADHDKRLENIEALLENIPQQVLEEAKMKVGA